MKSVLLLLLLSLVCSTAYGFQDTDYFDPGGGYERYEAEQLAKPTGNWAELTEGIDYEEAAPEPIEESQERERNPVQPSESNGFFVKLLLVVLAIVGLVFAILHFTDNIDVFKRDRRLRRSGRDMSLSDIEDQLDSVDLKDPIEQAVADGNYAVAVRLLYLQCIQALNDHRLIRWKRDKTNGDYLRELPDGPLREDFAGLTGVFERIWYGEKPIEPAQFSTVRDRFRQTIRSIQNTPRT